MKTTGALLAPLLLLHVCSRARAIVMEPWTLVLSMAQDDRKWATYLNVDVKVDTALLTPTAAALVQWVQAAMTGGAAKTDGVVTVNALAVVVEAACSEQYESEVFDVALAAAASAVQCAAMPLLLVQARAIDHTLLYARDAPDNLNRPAAVLRTLSRYLNRLAGLRDSLSVSAQMFRLWEMVVRQTMLPSSNNADGVLGDVQPFCRLVDQAVHAMCAPSEVAAALERLKVAGGPDTWNSAKDTDDVFDRCQRELDELLERLPVVDTLDEVIWNVVLHGYEPKPRDDAAAAAVTQHPTQQHAKQQH